MGLRYETPFDDGDDDKAIHHGSGHRVLMIIK